MTTHKVKEGESLWRIADRHFGDPHRWKDIASLNRLPNGNLIYVGQELLLPNRSHDQRGSERILSNVEPQEVCRLHPDPLDTFYNLRDSQLFSRGQKQSRLIQGQRRGLRIRVKDHEASSPPKNEPLRVLKPACKVGVEKDETLFRYIAVYGHATVSLELKGSAEVSSDGYLNCSLSNESISAELKSTVKGALGSLESGYEVGFSIDPKDLTAATISVTVVFKAKKSARETKFKCSQKFSPLLNQLVFESDAIDVTLEAGGSKVSGKIGLKMVVTVKPPSNVQVPVPVTEDVWTWVAIGAGVVVVAVVVILAAPAIATGAAAAAAAAGTAATSAAATVTSAATAMTPASVSFASALVLFGFAGELERTHNIQSQPESPSQL